MSSQWGDCVEVALTPSVTGVRDSKDPDGQVLVLAAAAWTAFLRAGKTGRLDLS